MKICGVVSTLGRGGSERVMASLVNYWAAHGEDVSLLTLGTTGSDDYALHAKVRRVALGVMSDSGSTAEAVRGNIRRVRALRSQIRALAPDVVVSFNGPVNIIVLLACWRLDIPVIVSERIHPPAHDIGRVWVLLRWLTYRLAAAVVVQSEATRDWAASLVQRDRVFVIPNSVERPPDSRSNVPRSRMVLGVGRLVRQKGFDLLIQAFGAIARGHPDWSLTILGRGPEEAQLRALSSGWDRNGVVCLPGAVVDPERYYQSAALFVLPSRYEGFPNTLLEAMAGGCAVIAADCPVGPGEIVRHEVDGLLVTSDDVGALSGALTRLMADDAERRRLGTAARQVTERFSPERIMRLWADLIARVTR